MLKENTIYKTVEGYYTKVFEVRGEHVYRSIVCMAFNDLVECEVVYYSPLSETRDWKEVDAGGNEVKEKWKPEYREVYWFVGGDLELYRSNWDDHSVDRTRFEANNVFRTEEAAEDAAKKIKELLNGL